MLSYAQDVRWIDRERGIVALALGPQGVAKVSVSGGDIRIIERICDNKQAPSCDAMVLSADTNQILFSGWAYTIKWTVGDKLQHVRHPRHFNAVLDHDLAKGKVIWVGGQYPKAGFCADGAIAWTASLKSNLEDRVAAHQSTDGPGCKSLDHCLGLFLPRVRFLMDGSYVISPGVEDGVFHYKANGTLDNHWKYSSLGVGIPCDFPEEARNTYFSNDSLRHAQKINKLTIIDEILPVSPPVEIILRKVKLGGTITWHIIEPGDPSKTVDLPFISSEATAHLRADLDSGHFVFIGNGFPDNQPAGARLIVVRLK